MNWDDGELDPRNGDEEDVVESDETETFQKSDEGQETKETREQDAE